MQALLLSSLLIVAPLISAQQHSTPPNVAEPSKKTMMPVKLDELPMEGGWTYQEILKKAETGDFDANMLLAQIWQSIYKSNLVDNPGICIVQIEKFARIAAQSGHPAPVLIMTDPCGAHGVFKGKYLSRELSKQLTKCRQLAEQGDLNAIMALMEVCDLPKDVLKSYLDTAEEKAKNNWNDYINILSIREEVNEYTTEETLNKLLPHQNDNKSATAFIIGLLADKLATASKDAEEKKIWLTLAKKMFLKASAQEHAAAMTCLAYFKNAGVNPETQKRLLHELFERGDIFSIYLRIYQEKRLPEYSPDYTSLLKKGCELELPQALEYRLAQIENNPDENREEIAKHVNTLLRLEDSGVYNYLIEPYTVPATVINTLPLSGKSCKELQSLAQLGDVDAMVALGILWDNEVHDMLFSDKMEEALDNAEHWFREAEKHGHPYAKFMLAEKKFYDSLPPSPPTEESDDVMASFEPSPELVQECFELAKKGDFYTTKLIIPYLQKNQVNEILAILREKAYAGDALSQAHLAYHLVLSYIDPNNDQSANNEAFAWARQSAAQLHPEGLFMLGYLHKHGFELKDKEKFKHEFRTEGYCWLWRAALKGHVNATYEYMTDKMNIFSTKDLANRNMVKGLAMRGHLLALSELAELEANASYEPDAGDNDKGQEATPKNKEEEQDFSDMETPPWLTEDGEPIVKEKKIKSQLPTKINPKALQYWETAASLGSSTALDKLAQYYEDVASNTADIILREQYLTSAIMAANFLVKKNDSRGYLRMAHYYEKGLGVQANKELYTGYIKKAAETDDPNALVEYARLLVKGDGVEANPKKAFEILNELHQRHENAPLPIKGLYFMLGYVHEMGLGTPVDYDKAYEFYLSGASDNDSRAINNLGSMYERGAAPIQDLEYALKYYKEAAELGNEDAKANFDRISDKYPELLEKISK